MRGKSICKALLLGVACACLASACAQRPLRTVPDDPRALAECPAEPAVSLTAVVLPLKIPPSLLTKYPGEVGERQARRLVVSFAPDSLARGDSVLWTHLSVRTFGGTLDGWLRLDSGELRIDATGSRRPPRTSPEQANIGFGPGFFDVTRSAAYGTNLANAMSVDLLLRPGGIPIDESLVRVRDLWNAKGKPAEPDAVHVELEPIRHVPGFDTIEAEIKLEYVLARSGNGAECRGLTQQRVVLATREAVRPPLWDLGVSSINSGRTRWLALSDATYGVFRAIFDSPTAAASFANWVRVTRAERVGAYRIGLVQQYGRQQMRPLVPVDRGSPETFQPLDAKDASALRTGPLGEP
jgi:hypothetical protein